MTGTLVNSAAHGADHAALPSAAIVVDPYSSGKYLLMELERRSIMVIAIRSSTKMAPMFQGSHDRNKHFFAEVLEFEEMEGLANLVDAVNSLPYKILGVLTGSEPGVRLADRLSDALGFAAANPTELLEARTDKAEMQEALRRIGVPAAEQFKSGNLDALLAWADKRKQWPLIAKPTGGAGGDCVFFCKTEEDVREAHRGIIGNLSITGTLNSELALQEFLVGDEYIVDTVSHAGKHICMAIWVYKKAQGLPWNRHAICPVQNMVLPPTGERQDRLVDYAFQVLDAVGLKYGPCHLEIMLTARGPILVEVNARLHGLTGPRLIEMCTGNSLAALAIDAVLFGGELFRQLYQSGSRGRYLYPMVKQCVNVCLLCPVEGYLQTSIKQIIADMQLVSVVEILPMVAEGGYIHRSKDLPTLAGIVNLVHESLDQINSDIRRIREVEADLTLYEISSEALAA